LGRTIPILFFILLTAISSQGQSSRSNPATEGGDRIIKLYPNPATSYITFDLQKANEKGLSIQVYNFLGKKMYETQNVTTEKITVDLAEFNRGVYIYHLRDLSGKIIESGKFQVSR
jgi:hypothetical protein